MFIDHVVVRVWGPEKVFKFSICLGAGRNALFLAISMWRFLLLKDSSSFPAPGWEDSLFPGAGSRLPAPGLPPGAGSPPGAGWSLPPFPVRGGSFLLLLAERPATAATYSMFVAELRASKSSFPSNGARVTRSALRFQQWHPDTRNSRRRSALAWRDVFRPWDGG